MSDTHSTPTGQRHKDGLLSTTVSGAGSATTYAVAGGSELSNASRPATVSPRPDAATVSGSGATASSSSIPDGGTVVDNDRDSQYQKNGVDITGIQPTIPKIRHVPAVTEAVDYPDNTFLGIGVYGRLEVLTNNTTTGSSGSNGTTTSQHHGVVLENPITASSTLSNNGYDEFLQVQKYDFHSGTGDADTGYKSITGSYPVLPFGYNETVGYPGNLHDVAAGSPISDFYPITNISAVLEPSTPMPTVGDADTVVANATTESTAAATLPTPTSDIDSRSNTAVTGDVLLASPTTAKTINVKTYGATGNGVTDDTAAIQAAANAAAAQGKQLFFPDGTYLVSQAIVMDSNESWTTLGGAATLVATTGNTLISAVLTDGDTLSGLTLEGGPNSSPDSSPLLIVYRSTGFDLSGDTIMDTEGIGALFSDVNDTTVQNSDFATVGNDPADLAASNQGVAFSNDISGYGNSNIVSDSTFTSIGLDAISATGQTGFEAISNTMTLSSLNPEWIDEPSGAAGVYGYDDSELTVANNTILDASGTGIDTDDSSDVNVYQNIVEDSGAAGIGLFSDTTATASFNLTLDNNEFDHFDFRGGISIDAAGANDIIIANDTSGNDTAADTQLYGVQVLDSQDSNASNIVIAQNNVFENNQLATISDPAGTYDAASETTLPTITYPVVINDVPTISGVSGDISTDDTASVEPFALAMLSDPDNGVDDEVTVVVSGGDTNGQLSGLGVSESATPGTYSIGSPGDTPAQLSVLLQRTVFTPTVHQVPEGVTVVTTFDVEFEQTSPSSASTVEAQAETEVTAEGSGIVFESGGADSVSGTLSALDGDTVTGFTSGDTILLEGVIGLSSSFDTETGVLTLSKGTTSDSLQFVGPMDGVLQVEDPPDDDTMITLVPCFAKGTRIATPRGEVPVEALRAGDDVLTVLGEVLPVIWTGRRHINCSTHPEPERVLPILIQAHAFAEGVPHRDLLLSPDHAILALGVLIPAKQLVNDITIRQMDWGSVTYHHIELKRHAIVLAEGLPTESYLDTNDRLLMEIGSSANVERTMVSPEGPEAQLIRDGLACAPIQIVGHKVDQMRAWLNTRAEDALAGCGNSGAKESLI